MPDASELGANLALDSSVAVPILLKSHSEHKLLRTRIMRYRPCLTAHSLAETYSVLTRLPGDARLLPDDALALIDAVFLPAVPLPSDTAVRMHAVLADASISGGAVYDALVALAAKHAGLPLATRDLRAASAYAALGVRVELFAS